MCMMIIDLCGIGSFDHMQFWFQILQCIHSWQGNGNAHGLSHPFYVAELGRPVVRPAVKAR